MAGIKEQFLVDQAYHNAVKKKKQLEAELLEVETFLSLYPKFSGAAAHPSEGHLSDSNGVDASLGNHGEPAGIQKFVNRRRGNPDQIASIIESILMSHNRPMTRGELASEIEAMGVGIPADDKAKYIGTILWRKRRQFQNLDGKGYWLKGLPVDKSSTAFWFKHSAALAGAEKKKE